jgi:hypothetical protein
LETAKHAVVPPLAVRSGVLRIGLSAAILVLLAANPALAEDTGALDRAIAAHQQGEFELARDALLTLLNDPSLTAASQVKVRAYLASSYLALKDPEHAAQLLKDLLRGAPETVLDPNLFVPELIVLEQRARLELEHEKAPPPEHPARVYSWVPAVLTVASGAVGAYFAVQTADRYQQLTGSRSLGPISPPQETMLTQDGRTFQIVAGVMLGIAVAALVTTGITFFWRAATHAASDAHHEVAVVSTP